MDISRILTFSSLQTLRSNSWISGVEWRGR